MSEASPRLFLDLARMMIKQARILREAGLVKEAGELALKAMAIDTAGWNARSPQPVPIRVAVRRNSHS